MADNDKNENSYVGTNSKIKKIRYAVITVLVITVAFALFFYREELTVENLRYLMKYVDVEPVTFGSGENTQINFESDSATVTGSFKKDLIVLTKSSVKIYDLSSKEIFRSDHSITNPALSVGERYFAVYDMGGKYIAVYNSFSKLWETTLNYPIYDVALDDKGNISVATTIDGHASALMAWDNRFEERFKWSSVDKYTLCTDIHSDGSSMIMAAGALKSTADGDMLSSVITFSADSKEPLYVCDFASEMVVATKFNGEGNLVCLTDIAVRTLSPEGELLSEYLFNSKALRKFEVCDEWTVLLLNENLAGRNHRMIIFDANGDTYMEKVINSEITDVCISKSHAFLLGVEDIIVADLSEKEMISYDSERSYRSVELIDRENIYLVYDSMAFAMGVEKE